MLVSSENNLWNQWPEEMSGLTWIQSDGVPKKIMKPLVLNQKKKSTDDKKSMKNYIACGNFIENI